MRGMLYLTDRPHCEWPELVKIPRFNRKPVSEHKMGWTPKKARNNDRRSSSDKTGQATRARQRAAILKRWGPVCHICWDRGITDNRAVIDLSLAWPHPQSFTRDHVIPRSVKGIPREILDDVDNLKPAHHQCNRDHGNGPIVPEPAEELETAA